jgi:hypothetical protein
MFPKRLISIGDIIRATPFFFISLLFGISKGLSDKDSQVLQTWL